MRTLLGVMTALLLGCGGSSATEPRDISRFGGRWVGSSALISLDFTVSDGRCAEDAVFCPAMGTGSFTTSTGRSDKMEVHIWSTRGTVTANFHALFDNVHWGTSQQFRSTRATDTRLEGEVHPPLFPAFADDEGIFGTGKTVVPIVLVRQ